jgi:AraC-like DNA-binding protein
MYQLRKVDGFDNEQFFVIPDKFLRKVSENPLSEFLTVTDIGYFPLAAHHYRERPDGCQTSIIIYCSAGSGHYIIKGGKKETLLPGKIIVIPPNTPHTYYASTDLPWSIYWVHVDGPFFHAFYKNIVSYLPLRISNIIEQRVKDIFRQCFNILNTPYEIKEFLYLCQMIATMLSLINCADRQDIPLTEGSELAFNKAISFMHDHIHELITRDQLQSLTKVSQSQLNYLFKRATGFAPIEYFLRTKIHAASRDIYFSNLPAKDIAITYGIEDPYYFSRLFKKIMGMSPKNFRNKTSG